MSGNVRHLTDDETRIVRALVRKAGMQEGVNEKEVLVQGMSDGGMGSLRFEGSDPNEVRVAADLSFEDEDGILVLATLYIDRQNRPHELDLWKVDFSPVRKIPRDL